MRTHWSVLLVFMAACQATSDRSREPSVWLAPTDALLLAVKDDGKDAKERPRPVRITVEQAVNEALDANRVVGQARLAAAIAMATEKEARAGLLPTLVLSGSYNKRDKAPQVVTPTFTFATGPRELASYAIVLDFPIFAFGKYIEGYNAARFVRRGAEADSAAAEADIAAAATAAAFDLLVTLRAIEVADSNEQALARQVKDAQALLDAGRVTKSALLEAQVGHDRARREHEKLVSLVPIKRLVLNQLLGRPAVMPTEVHDDPLQQPPNFELEDLLPEAQENRPELRAARMGLEAAIRNHKAAKGAALPELRGSLSYQGSNSDFSSPRDIGAFGLTLDVPLFLGGANYARIQRAGREVEVARIALRDLEQSVHNEVATAHRDVVEAFKDIAVADRSIKRSEENLRIQREKFSSGRATSQEVLEATALLTQSRFDYISALYSYNNALSELHRVRGADPRKAFGTSVVTKRTKRTKQTKKTKKSK